MRPSQGLGMNGHATLVLYNPKKKKITLSRAVIFDESKIGYFHLFSTTPAPEEFNTSI